MHSSAQQRSSCWCKHSTAWQPDTLLPVGVPNEVEGGPIADWQCVSLTHRSVRLIRGVQKSRSKDCLDLLRFGFSGGAS